jgi:hypothetical protein
MNMNTRIGKLKSGSVTLDPALFPGAIEYLADHLLLFCHMSYPQASGPAFSTRETSWRHSLGPKTGSAFAHRALQYP